MQLNNTIITFEKIKERKNYNFKNNYNLTLTHKDKTPYLETEFDYECEKIMSLLESLNLWTAGPYFVDSDNIQELTIEVSY